VEGPFRADPGLRLPDHRPPGLRLIETMRAVGGIRLLPLHLARLRAGCAALGWDDPSAAVTAALAGQADAGRLRLTLCPEGVSIETAPLPRPVRLWRAGLALVRLTPGDPWLAVKSTHRPAYEQARADLPAGWDEAILLNTRDEVCDGTITTVFFDRGQGLRTPPRASGPLPGVLRAALGVPEEVLRADDLPRVRLWLGNAVRGLAPALFLPGG
jgi:4-amino-4-deoxychorismate lyase